MPHCKNDPKRTYKGDEPSPKGLGFCAHAEDIGKTMKGYDGKYWKIVETTSGVKRWQKDNKKLTTKDFDKLSKKYAKDNISDSKYKWMSTKQPTDLNFDNYLSVSSKLEKGNTQIILNNKNKNYKVSYFVVSVYDKSANKYVSPIIVSSKKHIFKGDLSGQKLQIIAGITAVDRKSGILDMELEKIVRKLE